MLRMKITELGKLTLLDDGGLICMVTLHERPFLDESLCLASFQWRSPDPFELAIGDLVSHYEHGVARYCGCKSINAGDGEKWHLLLEFAHGARLYVPISRSDLVQKLSVDCALSDLGAKGRKWAQSYCIEVLPNAYEWPGMPPFPKIPGQSETLGALALYRGHTLELERQVHHNLMAEWHLACTAFQGRLHADASYRRAVQEYLERQDREPQPLLDGWVYRATVLRVADSAGPNVRNPDERLLLVKRYVLRRERAVEKMRREVDALESCRSLEDSTREAIPENVRLFVWQRDKGQCVRCGSRERLEFDHIIPVVAGGSSTERNIQLLCESCNRSKGATV